MFQMSSAKWALLVLVVLIATFMFGVVFPMIQDMGLTPALASLFILFLPVISLFIVLILPGTILGYILYRIIKVLYGRFYGSTKEEQKELEQKEEKEMATDSSPPEINEVNP